jgi:sarcosine oxidase
VSLPRADVAIVGLGAMGSATALTLARRGVRVVGLDRLHPPHPHGSTHGRSRIIREAYYESPVYVPLVQRAYTLWQALERDAGRALLTRTGGLMLGARDGALVTGARRSAAEHGLPCELLDAAEIRRRFPAFQPHGDTVGVLEPRAGFLDPEACVESCLTLAASAGAELRFGTLVTGWGRTGEGIRVLTSGGPIECGRLILAAGPWLPELLPGGGPPLSVMRQVMYWFRPGDPAPFSVGRMPIFIWEWAAERMIYGFPDAGAGFKVARHHEGAIVTPDSVSRTVTGGEVAEMRAIVRECLPGADGEPIETATCLYTNTPDHHFVIGRYPDEPNVLIASPCSGHGFKFATAIGEVLADLAMDRTPGCDLSLFSPLRFR